MGDWAFAQAHPSQQLAQVHMFSITKAHPGGDVEFLITVKEFATPKEPAIRFLAQTDKLTNQKTAPYRPTGWGNTLLDALSECVRAIDRFPYEGEELRATGVL